MSAKTIWVREETYQRLDALRDKRETFTQVIERLIRVYETLTEVSVSLGSSHYLKEHPLGGKTVEEIPKR